MFTDGIDNITLCHSLRLGYIDVYGSGIVDVNMLRNVAAAAMNYFEYGEKEILQLRGKDKKLWRLLIEML